MASQKEKHLNSAQKWIQKGLLDRAIKDYEQIVAMDPKDVRHRQKLAELLARCNRNDEAVKEYETIARFYEDNGFNLKAIAVYKQIQKLDSRNIDISLTLAALNEKQGLIGNALSEYKCVFDFYENQGNTAEACKILEKMHAADPENIDIRLKLAETCMKAGHPDEAYQEYTRAALLIKNSGNEAAFDKVCNRIQTLFPDKNEFVLDLLEEQIKNGMVANVIPKLKQMLDDNEENHKVLSLYAEACKKNNDAPGRKLACEKLLHFFPDDAAAKEGLVECAVEDGDLEESLKIIDLYASDLIAAGLYGSLEKSYTDLQSQAPYDTRILEGLKKLYEATGDHAKLADARVSLKILSGDGSEQDSGTTGDAGDHVEDASSAVDVSAGMEMDFPWDEGLDLSVSPDEPEDTSQGYALDIEDAEISHDFTETGLACPSTGSSELTEQDFAAKRLEEEPAKPDQVSDSLNLELDESLFEVEFEEPEETEEAKEVAELEPVLEVEESEQVGDWLSMDLSLETDVEESRGEMHETQSVESEIPVAEEIVRESDFGGHEIELEEPFDKDDAETRFNLGIAYKEMGLYDEAMKEFTAASANPLRTVDCLILQGICLKEMGNIQQAEEVLTDGIDIFKKAPEKSLNLKYELGLLYEDSGRKEDALRVFREVFTEDPGFRETAGKIARLHGSGDLPDFSDIDDVEFNLESVK